MLQQNFEIDSSFLYILVECQNEFVINNVNILFLARRRVRLCQSDWMAYCYKASSSRVSGTLQYVLCLLHAFGHGNYRQSLLMSFLALISSRTASLRSSILFTHFAHTSWVRSHPLDSDIFASSKSSLINSLNTLWSHHLSALPSTAEIKFTCNTDLLYASMPDDATYNENGCIFMQILLTEYYPNVFTWLLLTLSECYPNVTTIVSTIPNSRCGCCPWCPLLSLEYVCQLATLPSGHRRVYH